MNSPTLASARRNLLLLACCQAVGQASNTMMFTATALSVVTFMHDRELATLPITLRHLGIMLSVFPAAMLMQRLGRRFGFQVGSIMGMIGAACSGIGLYLADFPMMCAGGLILGYSTANLQMYRFAAIELAPQEMRAKAISWVTSGGVVAGVLGPTLARLTHDQWVPLYLGTYAAMVVLHMIVFAVMAFIRFPPPVAASRATAPEATRPATTTPALTAEAAHDPAPRPLWVIASQPRFCVAVIAGMIAYGTMSFLMSASPLAIVGCGLPHTEAHWVIFLHVMGMFVPSFFTGNLIQRFGVTTIMLWGIAGLLAGVATGLMGMTEWHFRIALAVNGVGWNFLFVGATTLVSTTYRPSERGKTQALNDFLVFGTTATSSFLAGLLQERMGWFSLNWFSLVLVSVALLAVLWLRIQRPRDALA
jgi:MFS family permease